MLTIHTTLSRSWYFVILCTGFRRYAARGSLWPSFSWHVWKNRFFSPTVSRRRSERGLFWQ